MVCGKSPASTFLEPRGAYAPRSWCSAHVCRRKTIFAMHERTFTRAAGVSPPWVLGKRTCRNTSARSLETAEAVLTNAGGVAVANPRGLTPPALGSRCTVGEQMAIFAMHERTCTRAAGVSPPWYGESNSVPQESRTVQRLCDTESRAAGVSPPLYGESNSVPQESRTVQRPCDTESRAAGVSPPWV
jgi:hypothetical protein